ncbi:hypothetical protein PIB30_104692 [Stylosanthes scabra]|uniref:Uncharacterized protein n=1 Tax=Stylosanthes scabra TaxID=79078 RepID=A0ABU6U0R8_9FABA|nr:hypothetical protein [Stylosanthes scabra]
MRCGVVETSSPFKPSSDDGADNVDGMRCGRARTRRCGGMVSSEGDGREGGGVLWWPVVVVGKEGSDELRISKSAPVGRTLRGRFLSDPPATLGDAFESFLQKVMPNLLNRGHP